MTHFLHGNPVPPDRFIGRARERRRLIGFIADHGESAAVIGEPRIGKSSLLAYLFSPAGRAEACARSQRQLLFAEADAHLVGESFDPARFWSYVFAPLETSPPFAAPGPVADAYRACRAAAFGTTELEQLLKSIAAAGHRLVLFIDELEYLVEQCLRHHPAFLATLRALRKTGDFTLIVATRTPLDRLDKMAELASGSGSPCFNTFRAVTLGAMGDDEVSRLLRAAGSGLSPADEAFVRRASGGHPYLLQVVAGALVDASEDVTADEARREAAAELLRTTDAHMREIWMRWSPEERYVFAAVAAAHLEALGASAGWPSPDGAAAATLRDETANYRQELDRLMQHGFVARTGDRVKAVAVLAWFAAKLRQNSRSRPLWDTWMRDEGWDRFFSSRERRSAWDDGVRPWVVGLQTDLVTLACAEPAHVGSRPLPPRSVASADAAFSAAAPVDVFISYSHKDEEHRAQLVVHLTLLQRSGLVRAWHDRMIGAGEDWKSAIHRQLEAARIVILLVSADFLASDYCYDIEMQRALRRQEAGEAELIPILVRACDWSSAPFARVQALPKDAKPVTSWTNRDEAWANVAEGVRTAITTLAGR